MPGSEREKGGGVSERRLEKILHTVGCVMSGRSELGENFRRLQVRREPAGLRYCWF